MARVLGAFVVAAFPVRVFRGEAIEVLVAWGRYWRSVANWVAVWVLGGEQDGAVLGGVAVVKSSKIQPHR